MSSEDPGSIRDTPEYKKIQTDERFLSWLRMQDAAMDIEFTVFDVPELSGHMYTREGLVIAENEILTRYANLREMFSEQNYKTGMRFVYYIGETFRRAIEGKWVALPPDPPQRPGPKSMVEVEFQSSFYDPQHMIGLALGRRTGTEISWIFDRAIKRHAKWVADGRPARNY
ncbi:hypothetical protein FEK35_28215 [Nocardia cyriacigeorgica]|uniref:Uncharacterized protein n=1 Tax=Nocardia cyriacigeorgica TaxID=135487 RepID=A0A5R8P5P2_9NOCA|nr:hypothetical protein [Nocardia cyriacigeorgica]TLF96637.1 hypothetical protein FEK35_28215 [Nocardia cyriacigeorgica]